MKLLLRVKETRTLQLNIIVYNYTLNKLLCGKQRLDPSVMLSGE